MASVTITGFEDVLKMLNKLSDKGKVDNIAKNAVDSAKDIVASQMRSSLAHAEAHRGGAGQRHRQDRSTGAVSASVEPTAAKINSYGAYSVAKPNGQHPSGRRNAEVAAYLEYGKTNLPARPWRASAASAAEGPCIKIIEDYVKSEMGAE